MAIPRPAPQQLPWVVTAVALAAAAYLLVPIAALATRVPWMHLGALLSAPDTHQLLCLTLSAAALTALITTLLGTAAALWMQRLNQGARLVRMLVLLPLAMPPVVAGLALAAAIGNRGVFATLINALGWQFAFAFPGVVAAHIFVALPFVIVTVDAAARQIDAEVTASAAGIGMSPSRILTRITLPTLAPSIATGAGLAFARSLGEFGTTITFAGSMPGVTRTMSLAIYLERDVNRDSAYALSAVLILLALASLALASLPSILQRSPTPKPREIGSLDAPALRLLTQPESGGSEVRVANTTFPAGLITAVIGPNGSGKTTLMSTIAGRMRGETVHLDGRNISTTPAHRRGIVLLTQRPGLPRITTVRGALTMATGKESHTTALLQAAGLSELADVPIAALSGGQAAQVALLRALATRPRVLILDEPLAAIDVASAARWRRLLRATARDRTTLLVTHDGLDVAGLSEHVVVLERGQPIASGPTEQLWEHPPTEFVATLAGLNRLSGTVLSTQKDTITADCAGMQVAAMPAGGIEAGQQVAITFEPDAVTLRIPGEGKVRESARNVWPGVVESLSLRSARIAEVEVRLPAGHIRVPVTAQSALDLELESGTRVECVAKALNLTAHGHPSTSF